MSQVKTNSVTKTIFENIYLFDLKYDQQEFSIQLLF